MRIRAALLLSVCLFAAACTGVTIRRPSPDLVVITGEASDPQLAALEAQMGSHFGQAPDPNNTSAAPAGAGRELYASATAPAQTVTPDEETRRLMARRTALHQAYRDLGQQVGQIQAGNGQTIASMPLDEATRLQIEALILRARVVEESEMPTGAYYVKLALPLAPIEQIFPGANSSSPPLAAGMPWEQQREILRNRVRDLATQNARERLLSAVKEKPGSKNRVRIIDEMQQDPAYASQVVNFVQNAPSSAPVFEPGGVCKVTIRIDANQLRKKPA